MLFDIMVIAVVTALACSLLGIFLVLRGIVLMSDAISHTVVFGIVITYLLCQTFNAGVLMIGAVGAGICTVLLTEMLIATGKIYKEVAVGLVFPFLFSIGSLLICQYTASIHLDIDMVLLGEIALAPLKRMIVYGVDCGPCAFFVMGFIFLLNGFCLYIFYRPIQMAIFDQNYASFLFMYPRFFYYFLMILTSITIINAFEIVGSLVVVALMVVPAATALLCAKTMSLIVMLTLLFATIMAVFGSYIGCVADISIAGCITIVGGSLFLLGLLYNFIVQKFQNVRSTLPFF